MSTHFHDIQDNYSVSNLAFLCKADVMRPSCFQYCVPKTQLHIKDPSPLALRDNSLHLLIGYRIACVRLLNDGTDISCPCA